jgi:DNA repair exonuclease SbcCD nuclease subunit
MKIAIISDTHFGARNNSDIIIDQQRKFFTEIFFPYCKENNITNIVHLGDLFDNRKHINFKALSACKEFFIKPILETNMVMDIIPGNHCLTYRHSNELCSLIELLDQYPIDKIKIHMNPITLNFDGFEFALVPWINKSNADECNEFIANTTASFIGGHFEFSGFEVMKGVRMHEGMDSKLLKRFEQVISGHFHISSRKNNIWYLGTQYQMTWADCGETKYFHVLDTKTRNITPVKNPYELFEKVFYNEKLDQQNAIERCKNKYVKLYVVKKNSVDDFETFLNQLTSCGAIDVKIIENAYIEDNTLDDELKKSDLSDTPTLINKYLDSLETEYDKNQIKMKMFELFTEAQSL